MMKIVSKSSLLYIEKVLRYFTAFYMIRYGVVKFYNFGKPLQFDLYTYHLDTTIRELSSTELLWVFYSYAPLYTFVIGVIECVSGALLFSPKYKLYGALLSLPILANVFLMNYFYDIPDTAKINVTIYLLVVIMVCLTERKRISTALKAIKLPTVKFSLIEEFKVFIGTAFFYILLNIFFKTFILKIEVYSVLLDKIYSFFKF